MPRLGTLAATLLVVAASVRGVDAALQKTDVITLRNGDRLTCEVKELSRGQLKVSTDDIGTVYIEWDKITSITTSGDYEVAMRSGTRYIGTFAPGPPGTLAVRGADGSATELDLLEIVSFTSIKTGFFERIDGSVDVGGSYTESSEIGQFSFGFDATYKRPGYDVFTNLDANATVEQDERPTTRFTWRSGYVQFRSNRWTVNPFAFLERNPDLGLSLRTAGALAIGRYLHQSLHSSTLVAGGISVGKEVPIEGDTVTNVDALVTFTTSFYRYDFPRRNVDLSLMVFPALKQWGRVRMNAQAKFRHEFFRDFIAALSFYDTYDSQPTLENVSHNDFGVTLSLGWTF
jgi:hypothetical protein